MMKPLLLAVMVDVTWAYFPLRSGDGLDGRAFQKARFHSDHVSAMLTRWATALEQPTMSYGPGYRLRNSSILRRRVLYAEKVKHVLGRDYYCWDVHTA